MSPTIGCCFGGAGARGQAQEEEDSEFESEEDDGEAATPGQGSPNSQARADAAFQQAAEQVAALFSSSSSDSSVAASASSDDVQLELSSSENDLSSAREALIHQFEVTGSRSGNGEPTQAKSNVVAAVRAVGIRSYLDDR